MHLRAPEGGQRPARQRDVVTAGRLGHGPTQALQSRVHCAGGDGGVARQSMTVCHMLAERSYHALMEGFSVVTYNVLAQAYLYQERYHRSPAEAIDADRRRRQVVSRIALADADLLCLQELEPDVCQAVSARLATNHGWAYARRGQRPEGVAIFARRSSFDWRGHDEVHYDAHRAGDDDLALVVRLGFHGQPLWVCCTHLTWQPDPTPERDHLGRRQLLQLLAYRDRVGRTDTWIFAGDFNASPHSAVLAVGLQSGMDDANRGQRPRDTAVVNGHPRTLDYVLYSAGRLRPHPHALTDLTTGPALPSLTEPSDHLPLRVDFTWVA